MSVQRGRVLWRDGGRSVAEFFAYDSALGGSGRVCGLGLDLGGGIDTPIVVVEDRIYFFRDAGPGVGVLPGFVEFGAARFFFGSDAEEFADALADSFPICGDGTEVVALGSELRVEG